MHEIAMWPVFRNNGKNTGRSPVQATYHHDHPWNFQTGKGIFSTPVIDREGTIYFGSADHRFYALRPDGSLKWSFETGEIIDSAAALPAVKAGTESSILVPSGDGNLYCLRCDNGAVIWQFDARIAPRASFNNWWEANVAIGPDNTIYAGNTNFNYYALSPEGTFRWAYATGANAWSMAAFADDGTIIWGSNDTFIHAVHPNGERKWRRRTLGFIAASAAIGTDGTIYISSFDSNLYALDPDNGRVRWKFKTQDHIYSSAALSIDNQDTTDAVFFGSADGNLYAVNPVGKLLWRYDTGAPIRSSPVLGRKPEEEEGWIVYFGCGNGKLYALDAQSGARRWSFDTTPDQIELKDRNDLNGSPALSTTGITIGGEHGQLWYVPYDYPLHRDDPRGCTEPGEDFPQQMAGLSFVTPGGNIMPTPPETLPTSTILTLRLTYRINGESLKARLFNMPLLKPRRALQITSNPSFPFDAETSADGRHLHIIPSTFLNPDQDYNLRIEGIAYTGGWHIGNLTIGGRRLGKFSQRIAFHTNPPAQSRIPLRISNDKVTAFELTRLAVPIPTMLPSLNQIGFDYIDWIIGVVDITEPDDNSAGRLTLWAVGGTRNASGALVVDPQTNFMLPLNGTYRNDAFILSNHSFKMLITGIPIPFNLFQIRGQMGADLRVGNSAIAYADTKVLSIPTFGPLLVLAGLASNWWQKLLAMVTYITRPYKDSPANQRPGGIRVRSIEFKRPARSRDGLVMVSFDLEDGYSYPNNQHLAGILLLDADRGEVVALDYQANLKATADSSGSLQTAALVVPAGCKLPKDIEVIVMLDVFPLYRQNIA